MFFILSTYNYKLHQELVKRKLEPVLMIPGFLLFLNVEFNFTNIVVIIAAAQALLLHVLIFQKHRSLFANQYLALLMLCYSGILVNLLFKSAGLYSKYPYLFLISVLPLISMPLHYLYTKHLIKQTKRFLYQDVFHFIPAFMYLITIMAVMPAFIRDPSVIESFIEKPSFLRAYNISIIIQGLIYRGMSIGLINKFNVQVKNVVSTVEKIQLNWLKNITTAGIIAILVFLTEYIFRTQGINISNFIISSSFFAVYVYGIGYGGLIKSEVFSNTSFEKTMQVVEETLNSKSSKYEHSGLSAEAAEKYLVELLALMEEEKLFLNGSLTLMELSERLSISSHNLSEVINSKLGKNFYDFINCYRVEEVKLRMKNPIFAEYSIIAIAYDSGFNSKSSFNTIFKKHTGTTPSEYRKLSAS